MNDKKKILIRNSSVGLISQIVTMLLTFVTRSLFVKYIGIELLGLNSTFSSVLNALSLAELGFQTAIVYNLYKPVHDHDCEEINAIMNILKRIYEGVGIFFIAATLLLTPLLRFILKGINVTPLIIVYFWLQSMASVCTYFLAYKRSVLYADQKEYVSKLVDLASLLLFNLIQCIAIVCFKSYIGYLIAKILQTFVSNIIVHCYCKIHYSYLKNTSVDKQKLLKILRDVKNIFAGKIASFIYGSTDNIVISAFVSTIDVGLFVNYTTITQGLKNLTTSALSPVIPMLGNYLLDENNSKNRETLFFINTFVRYIIALFFVIPVGVLLDDFIVMWVGREMLLSDKIVFLLCVEFYIHLVHSATVDFINSAGLFSSDKYIESLGAFSNIAVSLLLVQRMGIEGVLIGTVVSQIIFWVGRSIIVYKDCLHLGIKHYVVYWIKNAIYIFVAAIISTIVRIAYARVSINNLFVRFIVGGIISELIIAALVMLIYIKSEEMKELKKLLFKK